MPKLLKSNSIGAKLTSSPIVRIKIDDVLLWKDQFKLEHIPNHFWINVIRDQYFNAYNALTENSVDSRDVIEAMLQASRALKKAKRKLIQYPEQFGWFAPVAIELGIIEGKNPAEMDDFEPRNITAKLENYIKISEHIGNVGIRRNQIKIPKGKNKIFGLDDFIYQIADIYADAGGHISTNNRTDGRNTRFVQFLNKCLMHFPKEMHPEIIQLGERAHSVNTGRKLAKSFNGRIRDPKMKPDFSNHPDDKTMYVNSIEQAEAIEGIAYGTPYFVDVIPNPPFDDKEILAYDNALASGIALRNQITNILNGKVIPPAK